MRFYRAVFKTAARSLAVGAAVAAAGPALKADSLWANAAAPRALVSDRKALAMGDILSILVQENTAASKDTSTKTAKKTGLDASISSFLFSPGASKLLTKKGQLPAMKMDSNNSFDGSGQVNNNEKIIARIAVTVIDVLPNGNLVVEGSRQTAFSGETQDAVLRGIVRTADIGANNTVYSYNVANATIRYISKGAASDGSRKGWFTKVWDKLTPF